MQITVPNIQRIFTKYNHLCFEGKLPPLPIKLGNAKNYLGQLRYKKRKDQNGHIHLYDFSLRVNTRYALEEEELVDVVIHEMIHYYIDYNNIMDTSTHGIVFQRIMNDINTRYGRNIQIFTNEIRPTEDESSKIRALIVCVATLKDGTTAVTVCARTRVFDIYDDLQRMYPIQSFSWYFTTDSFFNRFPRCMTAKLFKVDKDELCPHLATALELERIGNVIRPKKK